MKAKFVFENIRFERGRDPKTAIGIGGIHLFKDLMLNRSDILKKDPEKWIEWMDVKNKILDELPDDFTNELSTDEQALEKIYIERPDIAKELTSNLNRFLTSNESVNFEKGRDPKDALGIGSEELRMAYKNGYDLSLKEKVLDAIDQELLYNKKNYSVRYGSGELKMLRDYLERDFRSDGVSASNQMMWYLASELLPKVMKRYKISKISESVHFERGKDPKRTLGIGVIAKIEQIVNDAELLNDLFVEIDQQINSAMEVYLPQEEKKEFARMWLSNLYDSLPHYEFKVLYREDGDEEDASGPKVDYEVKELEEQGWKVFWEEDNFGQVETILYKEIKDN